MTAILGYACVSTTGQDLDALLVALAATRHALERVIADKLLGSAKGARPGCRRCPTIRALETPWSLLPSTGLAAS